MWYFHFSKLDTFDVSSDTMQNSSASTKNKIKVFTCVVFKGLKKARKAASLCIMRLPQKHQWGPSLPSCGGSHEQVCFSSLLPRPSGMGGWNHCVGVSVCPYRLTRLWQVQGLWQNTPQFTTQYPVFPHTWWGAVPGSWFTRIQTPSIFLLPFRVMST